MVRLEEVYTIPKEVISLIGAEDFAIEPYLGNLKLRLDWRSREIQSFIGDLIKNKLYQIQK